MSKLGWFLLTAPDRPWASILQSKYCDGALQSNGSPVGKGIVKFVGVLRKGVCFRVGNGDMIDVWSDPLVPLAPGF